MNDETKDDIQLVPPPTIKNLKVIGDILLTITLVVAAMLVFNAWECVRSCDNSLIAKYVWHYELLGFAIVLAISAGIQHQLFQGLSSIIEQLFEIRKNTSQ